MSFYSSKIFPAVISFSFPGIPHVHCLFSTALAGNMAQLPTNSEKEKARTTNNRKQIMDEFSFKNWIEVNQVHSDTFIESPSPIDLNMAGSIKADGMFSDKSDYGLTIRTADCQPILLTEKKGRYVAAIHCGWRGNVISFPSSAVEKFCKFYNIKSEEVLAVRGPSLGPGYAEFINFEKEWPQKFSFWFNKETKTMDLWQLTRYQLHQSGVPHNQIFSIDLCTYSLPNSFFSYRRRHTGRQVSIIWKNDNEC